MFNYSGLISVINCPHFSQRLAKNPPLYDWGKIGKSECNSIKTQPLPFCAMESPPLEGSLLKTKSGQSQADIFREIFSNSPRSSPTVPVNPVLKTNPTLFSIIEELILTEESYIGGLIYLLVNYLKPLVATRTSGTFIVHTCSLVETLITINQSFLTEIKNYACISEGQTFSDSEPNGITEKVAMLVSDRAVPKLVYTEYISIYERSLKAIKRCNIHADSIKHLGSKKLDMSLISLLQKVSFSLSSCFIDLGKAHCKNPEIQTFA